MLPYPVLRTHRRPASGAIAQPRPVTTIGAIGGGGGDKGLGEEDGGGEDYSDGEDNVYGLLNNNTNQTKKKVINLII